MQPQPQSGRSFARACHHLTAGLFSLLLLGTAHATPPDSIPIRDSAPSAGVAVDISKENRAALVLGEARDLIVELAVPASSSDQPPRSRQHDAEKDDLMRAVTGHGIERHKDYSTLPMLVLRVPNERALNALLNNPRVKGVYENRVYAPFLSQSLPLIHQPAAAALFTGAGTSVVVLDTGLEYTHAAFGSCTAPGVPSSCRVSVAFDTAPQDNLLDDPAASKHGTNVAGIVAGVAPGTRLIGIDVFSPEGAYTTDVIEGIDWAIANRTTYNIKAINMSLGGGYGWSAPCTGTAWNSPIINAKNAGIAVVVASGNDALTNYVREPACVAEAISVGAVYDANVGVIQTSVCTDTVTAANRVACFSNSASFLDLLAPGAMITAAGITMGGTSQATPHVAGAVAVAAQAYPAYSAGQIETALKSNGVVITDHRNARATPRVDLAYLGVKQNQTITFSNLPTLVAGGSGNLSATASSGLPVSFSSLTTGICKVNGSTVTGIAVGTCTVAVNQSGNTQYNAAPQVTRSTTVGKGSQTISFASLPALTVGHTANLSATASSGLAVTFTSLTTAVCTVTGSTVTALATGTCSVAANQAGNVNYNAAPQVTRSTTVGKGSQTITFGTAPVIQIGGSGTVSATASSGLAVTYSSLTPTVCTVSGSTVRGLIYGTCTIAANQAGNVNYLAAPQATQSFTIRKLTQTITFNAIPALKVGGSTTLSATASSGLAVTFNSQTTAICSVSGSKLTALSAGTCTVAASQGGNATYQAASTVTRSATVSP